MGELSIEEKAKAYDEAIERARKINSGEGVAAPPDWTTCEVIFPELKESEDEKIRKALISILKSDFDGDTIIYGTSVSDIIAWLEKQGEQKVPVLDFKAKDWYVSKIDGKIHNIYHSVDKVKPKFHEGDWLEKQGEQSQKVTYTHEVVTGNGNIKALVTEEIPANKVEPKFKVGDWLINPKTSHIIHIKDVLICDNKGIYELENSSMSIENVENNFCLWSTQDAKDGDILVMTKDKAPFIFKGFLDKFHPDCPVAYGGIVRNGTFDVSSGDGWWDEGRICPATKEQRDLLFQKMKEAGYEWDAEKKELRKIEQEQAIDCLVDVSRDNWEFVHEFVEKFGRMPKDEDELNSLVEYVVKRQKPNTWSEEDEKRLKAIIGILDYQASISEDRICATDGFLLDDLIDFLKDFKERCTWKPSDEQVKGIECAIKTLQYQLNVGDKRLNSLYNDLKKLKR